MSLRFNSQFILILFMVFTTLGNDKKIDFDRDIRPILSDNCFHCHGPDPKTQEAKLRLDTFEGATADRKRGAAIIPGNAQASDMIKRMITDDEDDIMPPLDSNRKVSKKEIELIKLWIDQGAKYSEHWAFVPVKNPDVPEADKSLVKNPIDNFVLIKLKEKSLKPNPAADKRTLLRRLSLDLTGLQPTPEEMNAFLTDNSDVAYEKQVDRLLKSPHYGERMAWPWLDAARYSDTNGYQHDATRTMWPWRDWVIKAFNENMPFDQFTVEQIAGDLLPNATQDQKLATAFLRNHMINGEGGRIPEENGVEYIFDQLETVGTTFMGLTFNCCRCHDHKYDPLSQKDYYSLFAFFNQIPIKGSERSGKDHPIVTLPPAEEILSKEKNILSQKENELNQVKTGLLADFSKLTDEKKMKFKSEKDFLGKNKKYKNAKKAFDQQKRKVNSLGIKVMVMQDTEKRKTYVLNTGLYNQREDEVTAAVPTYLKPLPKDVKADRLALAKWLVDKDNPLTARVTVNRLWAQVFGTGLVKTTENFGVQGERPVNQELLDWLAAEFVGSKWNVKHIMKLMVTSAIYMQSSKVSEEKLSVDPYNRFLTRGPRYRMPSWMIRDQALFSSGLFNPQLGGPGVHPYQPEGVWAEMSFGKLRYKEDRGQSLYRRSIYTFWRRIVSPTMFFDIGKRQVCEVKKKLTNTPLHALVTMNETAYVEAGRALAVRVMNETDDAAKIQKMYLHALGRQASPNEMKVLKKTLQKFSEKYTKSPQLAEEYLKVGEFKVPENFDKKEVASLANLALMIFNLDESLTRE